MIPSKRSVPNRLASTAASKAPPAAPSAQLAERVKYEILPVTEVSEPELEAFYAATYSERIGFLKSNWRWLYRLGAFDWASPPLVAVANRQIVGCLGNIPVMLRRGKNEHRAAWLVDLAIHPGLQRQGIGMALAKTAMAHYPILLGFGNERSQGALVKCGWQLRQNTQSFQLLLHPEQHPKFQRAAYSSLARVAGLATRVTWQARAMLQKEISAEPVSPERIAEFAAQDFGDALHVARSEAFLNWRIVQHPHQAEHVVLRQQAGGAGKCKAIARISNENGFRRLHLLSMVAPTDKTALSEFLASVVRWAAREDFHRVLLVTSDRRVASVAKWWLPISTTLRFICHANNASGWELLQTSEHCWECIDNDFDLT